MMKGVRLLFRLDILLVWIFSGSQSAADWAIPGNAPLLTRWARDVSPTNVLPEYPRPLMMREAWQSLNGLWEYAITAKTAEQMPGTCQGHILVPFCIESALSGVMKPLKPDQRLWYRRTFTVPADWAGKRILLHFGAADWETHVFLNGLQVDSHRGCFDPFTVELTKALRKDGPQELVVAVRDPTDEGWQLRGKQTLHPGGSAYTACSGIWQTVWLEPVPISSVDSLRLIADVDSRVLRVTVNGRTPPGTTAVAVTLYDGTAPVASGEGLLGSEITPGVAENLKWYKATLAWMTTTIEVKIPSEKLKLWSPDSPFLYDVVIELKDKSGGVLDRVRSYAGMRTITKAKDEKGNMRLFINGKTTMLAGALDQGYWPDGIYTAPTDDALRFDIEAAKTLGLTAIRKHIKLEPQRYYYWADKLGVLFLQDLPSGREGDPFTDLPLSNESATWNEMERRILIQKYWNHPSIICWVMFNEGWGQYDTIRNANWAKELDSTRLIDEASGFPRHGGGDVHDCHGGVPPREDTRISLDSETAGFGLAVPGHQWPGKGWSTGTYDPATGGETSKTFPPLHPLDDAAKLWYTRSCKNLYRSMWADSDATGCSGMFKVQLYDIETEMNGMLSYDREVWKVIPEAVAYAARGKRLRTDVIDLVPVTLTRQTVWRYTTQQPPEDWMKPNFNAVSWTEGKSGFGGSVTGGAKGSPWNTADIWLRQEFELKTKPIAPLIRMAHDEDVKVYLNGVLAVQEGGFTGAYDDYELAPEAAATLKPGKNVIAVHCHQVFGGQMVDVGLVDVTVN